MCVQDHSMMLNFQKSILVDHQTEKSQISLVKSTSGYLRCFIITKYIWVVDLMLLKVD